MIQTGFFRQSRSFSRWLGMCLFFAFCQAFLVVGAMAEGLDRKTGSASQSVSGTLEGAGDEDVLQDLLMLRSNADSGDASAQFELSRRYLKGDGLEQSNDEAIRWLRLAAEAGLPRAQAGMGWMYAAGKGVAKDDTLSFSWYERAAVAGFPVAQYMLGRYYEMGIGVGKDRTLAKQWYEKAAAQDNDKAKKRLQDWK